MQVVRQDSIVQSLSELRDIERQRIADEVAAFQRSEAARIAAREEAERRVREEAEARAKAEREAQLAAERARLDAEREERLRIDAAAAAELARQQVALEHARMERDAELRKAEIARTRPTWMMAVTVLSLAAAGAMLWLALSSRAHAEDADERARVALLDRDHAQSDARESQAALRRIETEVAAHAASIRSALDEIGRAKTVVDKAAKDEKTRKELERQQAIEAAIKKAKDDEELRRRRGGFQMPKGCDGSVFTKDCPGK